MSKIKDFNDGANGGNVSRISSSVEELQLAALERGDDSFQTGRFLVTYKEGASDEALSSLTGQGLRVADTRDFDDQAATLESAGDADVFNFHEIGVALISGNAAQERSMGAQSEISSDSPVLSIDPEYFQFAEQYLGQYQQAQGGMPEVDERTPSEFLRGFLRAAELIAKEFQPGYSTPPAGSDEEVQALGATWGLIACKVPPSSRSGLGIRVAVLDTGMDLGHPDFAGRSIFTKSFISGQTVQDLHGHGTHCIGTACGPKAPAGFIPRYGIGYRAPIFVGKVLSNSGSGTMASVLAGMNWAIANRCPVISMSLGAPTGVQPAYTAAGQSALNNGCLIIAAAGNSAGPTGAPGNSPTIMSVASLDKTLVPSSFSNFGKIEISGPGRDVFSSWPRPTRYKTISGTSMATPHVAGCAALWAETSPNLRGLALWRKLRDTAKPLPFPAFRVGAGLVQAP